MLRARRSPAPGELSIRELILRIRWERAKRAQLERDSPGHRSALAAESLLIAELHRRFGVENITATGLEWYVRPDRGPRAAGASPAPPTPAPHALWPHRLVALAAQVRRAV